ncbi:hypothetical protein DYU11_21000 [Fibrisoma montanum]|uniref:Uncharacterized protein n=2 Tax=Fibrisoma montanum TaxID=2305895 RepID=A0A418M3X4_9BACT|nr:hypothetical protein DYU11_21000 [Fibrisoma montanum]
MLILLSYCHSRAQSVQAMVKDQPFPYATGVAMDTLLYARIKTRLVLADTLRIRSKRAVDSLQLEIRLTRKQLDDQVRLGQYDAGRAGALATQMNVQQSLLVDAQTSLRLAQLAFDEVLTALPRRVRKSLRTADEIARATVNYVRTLQSRQWKWGGFGAGVGFVLGLALML